MLAIWFFVNYERHCNIFHWCDAIRLSYAEAWLWLRPPDTFNGVIFALFPLRNEVSKIYVLICMWSCIIFAQPANTLIIKWEIMRSHTLRLFMKRKVMRLQKFAGNEISVWFAYPSERETTAANDYGLTSITLKTAVSTISFVKVLSNCFCNPVHSSGGTEIISQHCNVIKLIKTVSLNYNYFFSLKIDTLNRYLNVLKPLFRDLLHLSSFAAVI